MSQENSANKRIAKNSVFMSIRMVLVLVLTLYTTRVLLQTLQVEDYGVYNVVCGFVTMFTFLNTSMSNGIQRFFSFELGRNGLDGAKKVYNTSVRIQILITILILICAETFGLWYLHNKMVIPESRLIAAEWIFQFSILSFVFIIMQVPYTAAVMAHEKMGFFAIVSVLDAVLKLVLIYAVPYVPTDRLVAYGMLFMLVHVLNFSLYFIYAYRNFKEMRLEKAFPKDMFKQMLSFSGWNLFGSFSHMVKEHGMNLVLNFFFGPVVNAARGIATQVNGGLQSFVQNITVPVRPQVVQSYAAGDINRTMHLTYSVSKLSCYVIYLMALPIVAEIDFILSKWLGDEIPEHATSFVIIIIATAFLNNLNAAISNVVHASGKMWKYQVFSSIAVLSTIPMACIAIHYTNSPELGLWMTTASMALAQIVALLILKTIVKFSLKDYISSIIMPFVYVVALTIWLPILLCKFMEPGLVRFALNTTTSLCLVSIVVYLIGLNHSERTLIDGMLHKIARKIKK